MEGSGKDGKGNGLGDRALGFCAKVFSMYVLRYLVGKSWQW